MVCLTSNGKQFYRIEKLLKSIGLPAWHPPQKTGFFRHIVVRKSFHQDQLLLNFVTVLLERKSLMEKKLSDFLLGKLGDRLAGVQHTINDNVADQSQN